MNNVDKYVREILANTDFIIDLSESDSGKINSLMSESLITLRNQYKSNNFDTTGNSVKPSECIEFSKISVNLGILVMLANEKGGLDQVTSILESLKRDLFIMLKEELNAKK